MLGSVSTGVIVSKAYGRIDIRKNGSGNVGMTNVMRTLGWVPSFLTFAGDALKGVLGAYIGKLIYPEAGLYIGGLCAILGHNYSFFYNFKGGKGMSTSFGVLLVADWRVAIALVIVQAVIVLITGYMSVASLSTAILLPISVFFVFHGNIYFKILSLLMCALALYGHRENIKRLIHGNENRLDANKITEVSRKMVQKIKDRRNKRA